MLVLALPQANVVGSVAVPSMVAVEAVGLVRAVRVGGYRGQAAGAVVMTAVAFIVAGVVRGVDCAGVRARAGALSVQALLLVPAAGALLLVPCRPRNWRELQPIPHLIRRLLFPPHPLLLHLLPVCVSFFVALRPALVVGGGRRGV